MLVWRPSRWLMVIGGPATWHRVGMDNWTEPGTFDVAPGVYRIPLPLPNDGLRAVNVYAIHSGRDLTLIDGGWALAESEQRLKAALSTLDVGLADINRFLVTHMHRDHYTQAVAIRRQFGTHVALGIGERAGLSDLRPDERPLWRHLRRLRECGAGPLADRLEALSANRDFDDLTNYEAPDEWLTADTEVDLDGRRITVHPTPGHTRGHVVFADPAAGALFAGDHVLPHITPSIGFEPLSGPLPLRDYLDSLLLVRRLPDMLLLPAHGPVAASVHERVDQLLDHHGARLDACAAAVTAGASTAYEAAHRLGWTRRLRPFVDLDPFNQMLAVLETAVHLDLLAAQGRLTAHDDEAVTHYAAA
jgi:glyoxylase-like metal-dependent hydrolase (beta-lactamase superfamily II)